MNKSPGATNSLYSKFSSYSRQNLYTEKMFVVTDNVMFTTQDN